MPRGLKFIDLFAGLGGFHVALAGLGHECVFACEIDEGLRDLYERNFGLQPAGDIREVDASDVPEHDVLCAGFPCQPFSKAGSQAGFSDSASGKLIHHVVDMLSCHQPRYVILENVPNLLRHDSGRTWAFIRGQLADAGYEVAERVLSPHEFGRPQMRRRAYIVGRRQGVPASEPLTVVEPPEGGAEGLTVAEVLDVHPPDAKPISTNHQRYLKIWQEFLDLLPADEPLPGFPIWAMESGATYPFEGLTPWAHRWRLDKYRGSLGQSLDGLEPEKVRASLPPYAVYQEARFPEWKQKFIRQNREFFERHGSRLREWKAHLTDLHPSFQKFEWNCGDAERTIDRHLVQFRSSGVRVKLATMAPSLVAMTSSLVPVVPAERRYMTPRECARLQDLPDSHQLPDAATRAYRALGNAVNVTVAGAVAQDLLHREYE